MYMHTIAQLYTYSLQFSSVALKLCPTFWDPMNRSMPGLPVHHQLPEVTQTHIHQVSDAIQPSHHLSSLFPPALNPSYISSIFIFFLSNLHTVVHSDCTNLDFHQQCREGSHSPQSLQHFICNFFDDGILTSVRPMFLQILLQLCSVLSLGLKADIY